MEPTNQQFCMLCNHKIHGRTDKKFCNDNCRNAYHNKINHSENILIRNIKAKLFRNRKILSETSGDRSVCTINRSLLVSKGFQFEFMTQMHSNKHGSVTYFCYDYSYKLINDSSIQILSPNKK